MAGKKKQAGQLNLKPKSAAKTIERFSLTHFVEQSYLDYSMYVILDRALPALCDGLKPVQRRIIYAMSELGLSTTAKPKKSARTIGDVIGKYHPHGELACYEAMVLMSQNFSYRYPLIDGQGNWGSIDDPKSFAAMRYTEARMTAYAATLLAELHQETVPWRKNFDGTLDEPDQLPAQLPNILLNGASGIAIGMSTDIPPHNLNEIAQACMLLLDKARVSTKDLSQIIKGPDFPSGADIVSSAEEIHDIYDKGSGHLRVRASYTIEKKNIIITSLPYQVSTMRVIQQIRALNENNKFNLISDLLDESDDEQQLRIVIKYRHHKITADKLMAYLFAHTDLERSQRMHFNVIGLDRKPQVKPLLQLLREWLEFRCQIVSQRLQARIQAIQERLTILDGFRIVFLHVDAVIKTIRNSEQAKESLIKKFKLLPQQADAILEMRLRRLAKIEQFKIEEEYAVLSAEMATNEKYLSSKRRLKTLVKKEIKQNMQKHGDERRSRLCYQRLPQQTLDTSQFIAEEKYTVAISRMGWLRTVRGYDIDRVGVQAKSGDEWIDFIETTNKQSLLLLDSTGRVYTLPLLKVETKREGQALSQFLNIAEGAHFVAVIEASDTMEAVLASNAGYAMRSSLKALSSANRNGKQILTVNSSQATAVSLAPYNPRKVKRCLVVAANRSGHILVTPLDHLVQLNKGKGRKLMQIDKEKFSLNEESMVSVVCLQEGETARVYFGKRTKKLSYENLLDHTRKCGQRGLKLIKNCKIIDALKREY